jgi:hypothetical protein
MKDKNIREYNIDPETIIPEKDIREKKILSLSKTFRFDWDIWISKKIKKIFKKH